MSISMNGYRDQLYENTGLPSFEIPAQPSDADLATKALDEEASYRFPSWNANDAVTLGLSLRKRFRGSSRHQRLGKGLVISIQTIVGHTLFACTVGDLGNSAGDVSLDGWACLEGMIAVVRRTGHSSFYVEKGMGATGKTPRQLGIQGDFRIHGGAFPIWLENAPCCPIAIVGCYSGSSADDHHMVVASVRDYILKMNEKAPQPTIPSVSVRGGPPRSMPSPIMPQDTSSEWISTSAAGKLYRPSNFSDAGGHEHVH